MINYTKYIILANNIVEMLKSLKKMINKASMLGKKKEVTSCALCMILVILVSQARLFDLLLQSHLGRIGLILLLSAICWTNKIFGVASVLFLVLAIAVQMNSREGLEGQPCEECGEGDDDCSCKKKEGMCGKMKKEEGFGNLFNSGGDRLMQERQLQKGHQSNNAVVKEVASYNAKPYDSLKSEMGSII